MTAMADSNAAFQESLIFNQLAHNSQYFFKVFPFLSQDYFQGPEKAIYSAFKAHFDKYDKQATPEILEIYLRKNTSINEKLFESALEFVQQQVKEPVAIDYEFMVDSTEDFVQTKALYNALSRSVGIFDEGEKQDQAGIPDLLNEALSISFNTDIGLDYLEDAAERFRRLNLKVDKIPFLCPVMNNITRGGFERKTLNLILASTGVGKSAYMCHYAAEMAQQGYNVLYVSMEMAEEKLGTRIDANLMNLPMDAISKMKEEQFLSQISELKLKGTGKIIIKEFPTASVHMGHVEALLRDLKMKKGFAPDIVCLDYLNICLSKRVSLNKGTYLFVKAIAEEFRGLAVKYNFAGLSAIQGTRGTIEASDMTMQDTGESKGINDTADFILGMMAPEEIAKAGLMLCKQLKSRYDDVNRKKRFVMAFDRSRQHFEEAEDPGVASGFLGMAQDDSSPRKAASEDEDTPLFDSSTGSRYIPESDNVKRALNGIKF